MLLDLFRRAAISSSDVTMTITESVAEKAEAVVGTVGNALGGGGKPGTSTSRS